VLRKSWIVIVIALVMLAFSFTGTSCFLSFSALESVGGPDDGGDTLVPVERFVSAPPGFSGECVPLTYQWEYRQGSGGKAVTHSFALTFNMPEELYSYYSGIERAPISDYSVYVTHPSDDYVLQALVEELKNMAEEKGFDLLETANFAASFVQDVNSIAYATDEVGEEYPKYPLETLRDKEGDCEDSSVLVAALLQLLGYDVVLISFPSIGEEYTGHMGVGVAGDFGGASYLYEGIDYYYLETTDMWAVGESPDGFESRQAIIYELEPIPVLTLTYFQWTVFHGQHTLTLETTVRNWGTGEAEGAYIQVSFDGQFWVQSEAFDLQPSYEAKDIKVGLDLPSGEDALMVQLVHCQQVVDETEIDLEQ